MATSDIPDSSNLTQNEQKFLDLAFKYAYKALAAQEVPVGCIFVYEGEVIALGRNDVNETRNATRHAEMICINQVNSYCAERQLDVHETLRKVSVYVTVEPCIMCAAALFTFGIELVVFGCRNDRFGGQTVFDVAAVTPNTTRVKGGHRADEAMQLLKEFYKGTDRKSVV